MCTKLDSGVWSVSLYTWARFSTLATPLLDVSAWSRRRVAVLLGSLALPPAWLGHTLPIMRPAADAVSPGRPSDRQTAPYVERSHPTSLLLDIVTSGAAGRLREIMTINNRQQRTTFSILKSAKKTSTAVLSRLRASKSLHNLFFSQA